MSATSAAAPAAKLPKLTYRDYASWTNHTDKRYELIDGELIMAPSPGEPHQRECGDLFTLLNLHVKRRRLGRVYAAPFDVVLSRYHTVQPDLLFVCNERRHIITPKNVQGPPDWVAEIISPGRRRHDLVVKKRLYAKFGVPEYWIVDPEKRSLELHLLEGGAYRLDQRAQGRGRVKSRVIHGFSVRIETLFLGVGRCRLDA